ncbi:hypothetical protein AB5I41_20945 [Sphingomonas sp. MMS24-JH45]
MSTVIATHNLLTLCCGRLSVPPLSDAPSLVHRDVAAPALPSKRADELVDPELQSRGRLASRAHARRRVGHRDRHEHAGRVAPRPVPVVPLPVLSAPARASSCCPRPHRSPRSRAMRRGCRDAAAGWFWARRWVSRLPGYRWSMWSACCGMASPLI